MNLRDVQQDNSCPVCGRQGSVMYEGRQATVSDNEQQLEIVDTFSCDPCGMEWYQTIILDLSQARVTSTSTTSADYVAYYEEDEEDEVIE